MIHASWKQLAVKTITIQRTLIKYKNRIFGMSTTIPYLDFSIPTDQSHRQGAQNRSLNTSRSKQTSQASTSSHRSKYIPNSKLTKSNLFSAIRGKKGPCLRGQLEEKGMEIELLQDALDIAHREQAALLQCFRNGFKTLREDCRKVSRTLEHFTQ